MQIRHRQTGAVMYEAEFRAHQQANGGPTWGQTTEEILNSLGADVVFEGPQAQPTRYQVAFADGAQQIGGKWYTKYSVADMSAEAKAAKDAEQAKSVRTDRNTKLAATDWTQGKDIPDNVSSTWAAYRQALRDITAQAGFPWGVQWPTQPE
jgi:hypothetical protein